MTEAFAVPLPGTIAAMSSSFEPPSVVAARGDVSAFHKRFAVFMGGVGAFVVGIMVAAGVDAPKPVMIGTVAAYMLFTLGGAVSMRRSNMRSSLHVIKEWESRGLREEFARFDHAVEADDDPRLSAAAGIADRIRALQASVPSTDAMVTRLEGRLAHLVRDQVAAASAVHALEAAGAAGAGTGRLAEAAKRLDGEIGRILSGLSELYAALLEAESGGGDAATTELGEVMSWLEAEAELAREAALREGEARPGLDAAAGARARQGA